MTLTEAATEVSKCYASQFTKEATAAAIDVHLRDLSASLGLSLMHFAKLCGLPAANRMSMARKYPFYAIKNILI
jgi:hypothetical protein